MDKPYKCSVEGCNASYTKAFKLEVHSRKHTGERPFRCDISGCLSAYTNSAHLRRHKSLVHEKSSEVICQVIGCGLVLNNKYSLKKHYDRNHDVVNHTFTCAKCCQSFKKKRELRKHLFLHTGEIPFKCSICNISFAELHLFNKHKRNHKTYTCDCGVEFDRWTLFCGHRKNSCSIRKIDHKCIICNKVFTTKTNLKQHSLCHIEESRRDIHHCPYINCRRSYKYKKNLTYHIAVFHEEVNKDNRIQCTEPGCEQLLKSKKNLKQHISKVHSGLPKKKKERRPRRDKGTPKKCMASIMSGVELPSKEHSAVIKSDEINKNLSTENITLQSNATTGCSTDVHSENEYLLDPVGNNEVNILSEKSKKRLRICYSPNHREREEKAKRTFVKVLCNIQELHRIKETQQNTNSDDTLLQYCTDVLQKIHTHLSGTPNLESSLVY